MEWLTALAHRLRALWSSEAAQRSIDEELQFHMDMKTEENIARGLAPEKARQEAERQFGNALLIKDMSWDVRGGGLLEETFWDLRYAARMLGKSIGFTATALFTLALGIAANTAIFSVVNAVMLRPLPYRQPDRLAMLWTDNIKQGIHEVGTAYPIFEQWKKQDEMFDDMAICSRGDPIDLTRPDGTERVQGAAASPNLFNLLGVPAAIGRTFSLEDEARGDRVLVLSRRFWQREFGSDPRVIGMRVVVNGNQATIVGVMPASFQFPTKDTQLWEPATQLPNWSILKVHPLSHMWRVVGRIKQGISVDQVQSEMTSIGRRLSQIYPTSDPDKASAVSYAVNVVPLALEVTGRSVRLALSVLFAAVVLVLVIASSNVANLLLVRGLARDREFAIRMALGAGRGRLLRQLLAESTLLSVLAGSLGIAMAAVLVKILVAFGPPNISRLDEVTINVPVLTFAAAISVLTSFLIGLIPALKLTRNVPNEVIKDGGKGLSRGIAARRASNVLVAVEFGLAVVLLSGAGLLIRSFMRIQGVDPGFKSQRVLTMRIDVPRSKSDPDTITFYQRALEQISGLPGVVTAGFTNDFIIERSPDNIITVEGHPYEQADEATEQLWNDVVSPGYFDAMGIRLLSGRFFTTGDTRGSILVAIINERMAHHFWPAEDPVGKRFKYGDERSTDPWRTVVGVVADMHRQGPERPVISQLFLPHDQSPGPGMLRNVTMMVRTASEPLQLAGAVESSISSIDKSVVVYGFARLDERLDEFLSQRRFQTLLLALFSAIALLLAGVGIYGLMHYSVTCRTREIGIRMALGADCSSVLGMVLKQGMMLCLAGLLAGLTMSIWLTRILSGLLFEVSPTDPITLGSALSALAVAALAATYLPARRATRLDPLVALHRD